MPKKPQPGDTVRVSGREATPADAKSGLFYPHFRGLTGTYDRLYKDGTALVLVHRASLPDDARKRHDKTLRYTVIVSPEDLELAPDAIADTDDGPPRATSAELEDAEARHLAAKQAKANG